MRGTKHDASQHQRRGIRSRLIASVAAVAMLATSIAAGTAVAADIDETDPTQQNTIVEQPQQGTENAGDQTGEQNTESEGDQTDQPQESDGTEAEAESDNADEADSTEEADPKTDADKTDGDQSAEKQSAEVPAPLAANAAESRASTSTFETPSTKEDVHVKLFDYYAGKNGENSDDQINAGHSLKFGTESAISDTTANSWTGFRNGVRQGLVEEDLQDGYPVLTNNNTLGTNGESLKYLFDPQSTNQYVHVKAGGEDVDGLFQKDEDGYYHYDSRFNFAKYDEESKSFKLYGDGRITQICSSYPNECSVDDEYRDLADGDALPGTTGDGAFLPFNDIDPSKDSHRYSYKQGTQYYWYGYSLDKEQSANYSFGMTVETQFYMPREGKVNGDDMVFEFSGDDDVWVFVDDKLVLDLGGIHDDFGGNINFADGTATVDKVAGQNNGKPVTTDLDDILDDGWDDFGSTHTLKVFYLERGAGGSNCKFRFNLPTISADSINVGKEITDSNTAAFTTAQFRMRVDIDYDYAGDGNHADAEMYTGQYEVVDTVTNQVVETRTATDGVITIGHGQYARLKSDQFDQDTWYKVTELSAENYDKSDYEFNLSNASLEDIEGVDQTGNEIGSSVWVQAIKTNFLIVKNKFNAQNTYSFTVSKVMAGGQSSTEKFSLLVTNENDEPYKGDYFLNGTAEKKNTQDGVIQLQAGQSATIMYVDPGTTFKVKEINLPSGYLAPTYSCSTGSEGQSCDTVTVDKAHPGPSVTVTNQMDRLDPPTITKKIGHDTKEDGSFDGDSYTLALDVKGNTIDTVTTSTTPLDIVLVLDRSGSMADPISSEEIVTYDPIYGKQVQGSTGSCGDWGLVCSPGNQYAGQYYALDGDDYVQITERTHKVSGDFYGTYQEHDAWLLNGREVTPKSSASSGTGVQFYEKRTEIVETSKMDALKEAVNGLIDTTLASSSEASVTHHIGIVSFAGSSREDKELTEVTSDTVSDLKATVDGLQAYGGTQSDDGLSEAKDLLDSARADAKKVVIFFTDGVPGGTYSQFEGRVAADAVNAAYDLKEADASVYSIGVFDDADPGDMDNDFNKYMNVVSSNYPEARVGNTNYGTWQDTQDFYLDLKSGERISSDRNYYLVADDSEGLNKVFQDIYQSESTSNGYTNVSIVDQLSEYAKLHENVKCGESSCAAMTGNAEVPITEGATLEVKEADGGDVQPGADGYPAYTLTYNPNSKTVKADLGSATLRKDWTYTLKFKVRPTQKAYDEYAANLREGKDGYDGTTGDPGTDLYEKVTSSAMSGFNSNAEAYVEYDANGEPDLTESYPHPVLQVEDASVKVTKTWEGSVPSGVDSVTVNLMDDETEIASTQLTSDNGWSGSFNHVAPGHDYTIVEEVPEGYSEPSVTYTKGGVEAGSLDVQTGDVWSNPKIALAATVTNTPAPTTYGTNAHLKLHKQLENQDLAPDMFWFKLELVSQPSEGAITLPEVENVPNGDANGNGVIDDGETDGTVFDFGDITFAEAGTYVLKVTESQEAETPSQGGRYSFDDHALYVRYTIDQNSETGALEIQEREVAKTDGAVPSEADWQIAPSGEQIDEVFRDEYLTWHNTYIAPVSSLPLTGGRSTARTLLLAGGGVLLVAGAAWLLARRRRV